MERTGRPEQDLPPPPDPQLGGVYGSYNGWAFAASGRQRHLSRVEDSLGDRSDQA